MPRVSVAFFLVAALGGLAGMIWGSVMGATHDHSLAPAHAHLNLVGWVTLALMGGFYALVPRLAATKLAWANFGLSAFGAAGMPFLLVGVLQGNAATVGPLMPIVEIPVIAGMLCFIASIIRSARTRTAAAT